MKVYLAALALLSACASSPSDKTELDAGSTTGIVDASSDAEEPRCLRESFDPKPVPLELVFLLDHSISMQGPKWEEAVSSLLSFADTARILDLSIGLQFFPTDFLEDTCAVSGYSYPLVPLQKSPGVVSTLKDTLTRYAPSGLTSPARPALEGTLQFLRARYASQPFAQRAVVMVTDGITNSCDSSTEKVAAAAASHAAQTPSIATYAVGMPGSAVEALDQIADAGGTKHSYVVGMDGGAGQLESALSEVREHVSACDYTFPSSAQGAVDGLTVSVSFRATPTAEPVRWPRRPSVEYCAGGSEGFYYDEPRAPTRLSLCPASCEQLRATGEQGGVTIVADCVRIVY